MARRGSFGRRPRSFPDLTNAVVAMAREYQNMRDQNIVGSWEKGGLFEGKKVTDEMLLDHLKGRMAGVSKTDPIYDEYQQRYEGYSFAVRNSKQELRYAQKKVGDGAMASFYRREAGRHPVNSEAWREMMKLSAQYSSRAAQGSGGGGGGGGRGRGSGRNPAYDDVMESPSSGEMAYNYVLGVITTEARRRNVLNNVEPIEAPDSSTAGQNFGDLQAYEDDWTAVNSIMNEFLTSEDPKWKAHRDNMTHYIRGEDENGNRIKGVVPIDPNFSGVWNVRTLDTIRGYSVKGNKGRLELIGKYGTKTQAKAARRDNAFVARSAGVLSITDTMTLYEEGRQDFEDVWLDPMATAKEKAAARETFVGVMEKTVRDLDAASAGVPMGQDMLPLDGGWADEMFGRGMREYNALMGEATDGGLTLAENSNAASTAYGNRAKGESDAATTAQGVNDLNESTKALYGRDLNGAPDPKFVYGKFAMVEVDKDGNVVPGDEGVSLVVKPVAELRGLGIPIAISSTTEWDIQETTGRPYEGVRKQTVRTVGALKVSIGKAVEVVAEGEPDPSGRPTATVAPPKGTRTDNVYIFEDPGGTTIYGVYGSDGSLVYTHHSPFAEGIKPVDVGGGKMRVTVQLAPGQKTYNPYDAIDKTFTDPTLRGAREDVTTSSTLAFALGSGPTALKDMRSDELDSLLKIEALSKPNPDAWYAASKAEAAKHIGRQVTWERTIYNRSDFMNEGARKPGPPIEAEGRESDYGTRMGGMFNVDETEFRQRAAHLLAGRTIGGVPIGDTSYMNPNQLRKFVKDATGQWMNEVIKPTAPNREPLALAPEGRESDFATRNRPLPPQIGGPDDRGIGGFARPTGPTAPKAKVPLPGKAADDVIKPKAPTAPKPVAPKPPTQAQAPKYYASEKLYAAPKKPKLPSNSLWGGPR